MDFQVTRLFPLSLKKEVEERLIKLSEDFQTMMQSKIDSTTKTAIIENSALRNEVSSQEYRSLKS